MSSDYIYTNEGLISVNGLMHYGVPGMKWGHRKAIRKFTKVGRAQGMSDYYRSKSNDIKKKHESMAAAIDKQAKQYDKQGGAIKAEMARRTAEAVRKRGMNASSDSAWWAEHYAKRSKKLLDKANKYADKKHVDLGKNKVNSILKDSRTDGRERAKARDEFASEQNLKEQLGERNYYAYNKLRGR